MEIVYGLHAVEEALKARGGSFEYVAIFPERRAVGVTSTVTKVSAGAAEYMKIARVTNIARALDDLKSQDIWIVGLDERGDKLYDELDYHMNCAIVLGAEGAGLHDLVRRKCDFVVSIPMMGSVASLNVSVAGGVMMYEVARQRRATEFKAQSEPAKPRKQKGLGS